mmetsp:Transcript_8400/g.24754  ORF Transcript_8400/g.24754 Transcript_8400/m.24754 type:complete len:302 (+) Transcript_8400:231-1136(+)
MDDRSWYAGALPEQDDGVFSLQAADLKNYNDSEEAALEKTIKAIRDTGVNLIVCGQAVGELALHFCEKFGILVLKCPSKFELRRICRTTGAANLVRLEPPAPDDIGSCARVYLKEIGSTNCTILEQEDATSKVATIVVRGSSPNIMDDVERAIDDGVHTVKAMTRDARFVAGAGGCELQLADLLQQHAEAQPGLDQYAINKYGLALEVVPRTLAENAGLDAANIVAALYAAHKAGERSPAALRACAAAVIASEPRMALEYVSLAAADDGRELEKLGGAGAVMASIAVQLGETRLIDNVLLP